MEGFRLRKIDWDIILKEFELLQIESKKQFAENLKALITHSNLIDIDNESFVEIPLHIWSDIQDKVEVFLCEKGLLNPDNFKDIVELFQRKKKSEWLNIFDCWCPLFSQLPNYYNNCWETTKLDKLAKCHYYFCQQTAKKGASPILSRL